MLPYAAVQTLQQVGLNTNAQCLAMPHPHLQPGALHLGRLVGPQQPHQRRHQPRQRRRCAPVGIEQGLADFQACMLCRAMARVSAENLQSVRCTRRAASQFMPSGAAQLLQLEWHSVSRQDYRTCR